MNDLDDQLNRTLREHADGVHGAPLAFDDVRGRATSIRRRRRLASGLGVAAAIAVIVPTAMFATNGNDSSPQPATALPTVTDTNTPVPDAPRRRWAPTRTRSTSPACRRGTARGPADHRR